MKRFSFVCESLRLEDALDILSKITDVRVLPVFDTTTVFAADRDDRMVTRQGTAVEGTCTEEGISLIVNKLAEMKIAGFSRESMVLFSDIALGTKMKV